MRLGMESIYGLNEVNEDMNFTILRQYMAMCEYYKWEPTWDGLDKYAKTLEWRKKYLGGKEI